ncbi:ABC transporter ATP-binding protein [Amycolatopsis jejuensis]|uniref:ABC transporter ATP-binding protein n=1 Tax=Amycolatopsis jejuensis TaxID=330084 RepID=UPI00068AC4CC|nr:ATP-binding cassette domain-containing protein [Amycolatopsis jejuensis]
MSLVDIQGLRLSAAGTRLLDGIDLQIAAGEAVGLAGRSGSGKTTTALAVLGHLRPGVRYESGVVRVDGRDMLPEPAPGVRGGIVGYVGQDPGAVLNPYARVGSILRVAGGRSAGPLLERVGLPASFARRYPHQLSGGQQQRVVLAAAMARSPRLLVLDEPTSALDPVATREVAAELARLRSEGVALLWISHDVESGVDRVVTVDSGRIVESSAPVRPLRRRATQPSTQPVVLSARALSARHGKREVLSGVDLQVRAGECLAVLGVSGAGKSTLARRLVGLHPDGGGEILLDGTALAADVRRRTPQQRAALGLVAQNPAEALHPRQDVRTALDRPLRMRDPVSRTSEIARLLDAVHLPASCVGRLPGELSGGQRQRVAVARALAAQPEVLICDEATAALDEETQAGILDLLAELQTALGLAVVLVTHDPRVAATTADHLLVLAEGRVAACGRAEDLLPDNEEPSESVLRLLGAADRRGVLRP